MRVVNAAVTDDPELALALRYAPAGRRDALTALFALDLRLRQIARSARDPTIGLMRLTWWAEALARLDDAPPPAEPLLQALAAAALPLGVGGDAMARLIDGWERLAAPDADLAAFAAEAGGRLFEMAAAALGAADARAMAAGEGWALVALAKGWPALAAAARGRAEARLAGLFDTAWPPALRPLGALALLARFDLAAASRPGSPRRVARLLAHRLTGR